MSDKATPWHEDDAFWRAMVPLFFTEEHWAAAPAEAGAALELLGAKAGEAVLDLGCGPGRHSLEFARAGLRVTGVDRTAAYLDEARRRATDEGLPAEFVLDDMRRFRRPGAYDHAVSLSTSFGYFDEPGDDARVVENLQASLKPGGGLVIEMIGAETAARDFVAEETYAAADGTSIHETRRLSDDGTWFEKTRRIVARGETVGVFEVSHRVYTAEGMIGLLAEGGFADVRILGGLAGAPYDERAEFLVAVARKGAPTSSPTEGR